MNDFLVILIQLIILFIILRRIKLDLNVTLYHWNEPQDDDVVMRVELHNGTKKDITWKEIKNRKKLPHKVGKE